MLPASWQCLQMTLACSGVKYWWQEMQLPAQFFRDGGIDMVHKHGLQMGEMVDQVVKCSLLGLEE
jgi:hypothetical protein